MDFNDLLNLMATHKASDMFITAGVEPSLKINGKITPVSKTKLDGDMIAQLIDSITTQKQRDEYMATHECNFAILNRERTERFRVSAFSSVIYLVWLSAASKPKSRR